MCVWLPSYFFFIETGYSHLVMLVMIILWSSRCYVCFDHNNQYLLPVCFVLLFKVYIDWLKWNWLIVIYFAWFIIIRNSLPEKLFYRSLSFRNHFVNHFFFRFFVLFFHLILWFYINNKQTWWCDRLQLSSSLVYCWQSSGHYNQSIHWKYGVFILMKRFVCFSGVFCGCFFFENFPL